MYVCHLLRDCFQENRRGLLPASYSRVHVPKNRGRIRRHHASGGILRLDSFCRRRRGNDPTDAGRTKRYKWAILRSLVRLRHRCYARYPYCDAMSNRDNRTWRHFRALVWLLLLLIAGKVRAFRAGRYFRQASSSFLH